MNKIYLLSCFLLFIAGQLSGQETATPVLNKSNRIILHFKDTTGLFTALGRILIDRGHDIEMKDREFGILRTKPSQTPGGYSFDNQMEVKTIFRDSTITFSSIVHWGDYNGHDNKGEVTFTKRRWNSTEQTWDELMKICELLKPESITYLTVIKTITPYAGYVKPAK